MYHFTLYTDTQITSSPHHYITITSPSPRHNSPSPHHRLTITPPSPHHHLTITSPSPHHQLTITSPSPHHHHHLTITSPPPHHHLTITAVKLLLKTPLRIPGMIYVLFTKDWLRYGAWCRAGCREAIGNYLEVFGCGEKREQGRGAPCCDYSSSECWMRQVEVLQNRRV